MLNSDTLYYMTIEISDCLHRVWPVGKGFLRGRIRVLNDTLRDKVTTEEGGRDQDVERGSMLRAVPAAFPCMVWFILGQEG